MRTIAHKEFMKVGIVIIPRNNASEPPTIDLSHERSILGVTKVKRNDDLFKDGWLEDAPGSAVCVPANAFLKFGVGENLMQFQRKRRFL